MHIIDVAKRKLSYFTNLNLAAIKGDHFPIKTMIPRVRENRARSFQIRDPNFSDEQQISAEKKGQTPSSMGQKLLAQ